LSAAQIAFDLRNPIAIARVEQPLPEGWEIGFCLAATGQTDAAIEHLRKGARLAPTYAPVWEYLGLAYAKQSRHRDAVNAFERATKLLPGYKQAWEHLAEEYHVVGRTADADQAAARAARLKNTLPQVAKRKG
jgi:tetratricopeptide (TPR) repeat protein